MVKLKLQILLIPLSLAEVPTDKIDPHVSRKFLHLTEPSSELKKVSEELSIRYQKLYPSCGELIIERLQDNDRCDLDTDFEANEVFSSGDILRVVVNNQLQRPNYSEGTPISSKSLDLAQSTPILPPAPVLTHDSTFSSRKRTQEYFEKSDPHIPSKATRKAVWAGPTSNPNSPDITSTPRLNIKKTRRNTTSQEIDDIDDSNISLPPPETKDDRSIPKKKNARANDVAVVPGKPRITSGMLSMPPHTQLEKADIIDSRSQLPKEVDESSSLSETSSSEISSNIENLDVEEPPRRTDKSSIVSSSASSSSSSPNPVSISNSAIKDEKVIERDSFTGSDAVVSESMQATAYIQQNNNSNEDTISKEELLKIFKNGIYSHNKLDKRIKDENSKYLTDSKTTVNVSKQHSALVKSLQIDMVDGGIPSFEVGRKPRAAAKKATTKFSTPRMNQPSKNDGSGSESSMSSSSSSSSEAENSDKESIYFTKTYSSTGNKDYSSEIHIKEQENIKQQEQVGKSSIINKNSLKTKSQAKPTQTGPMSSSIQSNKSPSVSQKLEINHIENKLQSILEKMKKFDNKLSSLSIPGKTIPRKVSIPAASDSESSSNDEADNSFAPRINLTKKRKSNPVGASTLTHINLKKSKSNVDVKDGTSKNEPISLNPNSVTSKPALSSVESSSNLSKEELKIFKIETSQSSDKSSKQVYKDIQKRTNSVKGNSVQVSHIAKESLGVQNAEQISTSSTLNTVLVPGGATSKLSSGSNTDESSASTQIEPSEPSEPHSSYPIAGKNLLNSVSTKFNESRELVKVSKDLSQTIMASIPSKTIELEQDNTTPNRTVKNKENLAPSSTEKDVSDSELNGLKDSSDMNDTNKLQTEQDNRMTELEKITKSSKTEPNNKGLRKRNFEDLSSSDESNDDLSDSDSDSDYHENKRPRLAASAPSSIKKSQSLSTSKIKQSPVHTPSRSPTKTSKGNNNKERSNSTSSQSSQGYHTPENFNAEPIKSSQAKTTAPVSGIQKSLSNNSIRKPTLTSLDDLALRGLPEVKDSVSKPVSKPSTKTKIAESSEEDEDSDSESDSSSDDRNDSDESDQENTGRFLNLKKISQKSKPRKKNNVFYSLMKDVKGTNP